MTSEAKQINDADIHYFKSQVGPNHWLILKTDVSTHPPTTLARYNVQAGMCECEGFKHRSTCRHLGMIRLRPSGVDRPTARQVASELIASWEGLFQRIVFDDYEFMPENETVVRKVKLKAKGNPVVIDGKEYRTLTSIRKNVFVELVIEP